MQSKARTVEQYRQELPGDRRQAIASMGVEDYIERVKSIHSRRKKGKGSGG